MITTGKKKDTVVCWREIGSFFIVAGNFHYGRKKKDTLQLEKKDTVVCLMGAWFWRLRPEKKRYSRLSDGCAVLAITTGKKKDTVVCLLGAQFWRLRPEKKRYSRLSDGLCCCIVFCSGGKF